MLQVMEVVADTSIYNARKAVAIHKMQPAGYDVDDLPILCPHCRFLNVQTNDFCTNCGYPTHPTTDKLLVYQLRAKHRNVLLTECANKVRLARNALYLLAAMGFFGLSFFFSPLSGMAIRGILLLLTGAIMFGLARWSIQKPFTALLISFLMMLTLLVIYAWGNVEDLFTKVSGVYAIVVQGVILFFLLQGVKAAYQAEVLEEEYKL